MTIVAEDRYLFVSYARQDLARVKPVVEAVRREVERRAIPVTVWMDLSNLRPGENWQEAILGALASSVGILFFVSAASLQSGWAHQELEAVVGRTHRLAIPVILDRDVEVPRPLSDRQWIDLSGGMTEVMVSMAASSIADALEVYTDSDVGSPAPLSDEDAPAIAADLAQEVRESSKQSAEPGPLRSVFVVTVTAKPRWRNSRNIFARSESSRSSCLAGKSPPSHSSRSSWPSPRRPNSR
jgi:hypothetical protein